MKVHELWLGRADGAAADHPRRREDIGRQQAVVPEMGTGDAGTCRRGRICRRLRSTGIAVNSPRHVKSASARPPGAAEKDKSRLAIRGNARSSGPRVAIHATGHNMFFRLLPEEQFKGVQRDRPETLENSRGPEQDWFAACRGGKTPWSSMDGYGSALNEFLMLGNVATQFDTAIDYDPVGGRVVNNKEADGLLKSEYRQGWSL